VKQREAAARGAERIASAPRKPKLESAEIGHFFFIASI